MSRHMLNDFARRGFAVTEPVLSDEECGYIATRLDAISRKGGGARNLLTLPWCADLARRLIARPAIRSLLPANSTAVQCTFFEKTPARNWLVAIHQDLSIPVASRIDDRAGWVWSRKQGVLYVQPPVEALSGLLAVRLHLDDCGTEDGALRVVAGSHRYGRLDRARIVALREQLGETVCAVSKGGLLLMRPLLLHASSKLTGPRARRVLHFLLGPRDLPFGLEWAHPI